MLASLDPTRAGLFAPWQVLPFCSEDTLQLLERNVTAMPAVSDLVQAGEGPLDMVGRLLQGLEWRQVGEQVRSSNTWLSLLLPLSCLRRLLHSEVSSSRDHLRQPGLWRTD